MCFMKLHCPLSNKLRSSIWLWWPGWLRTYSNLETKHHMLACGLKRENSWKHPGKRSPVNFQVSKISWTEGTKAARENRSTKEEDMRRYRSGSTYIWAGQTLRYWRIQNISDRGSKTNESNESEYCRTVESKGKSGCGTSGTIQINMSGLNRTHLMVLGLGSDHRNSDQPLSKRTTMLRETLLSVLPSPDLYYGDEHKGLQWVLYPSPPPEPEPPSSLRAPVEPAKKNLDLTRRHSHQDKNARVYVPWF